MPLIGQAKLDYMKRYRAENAERVRETKARCRAQKQEQYAARDREYYRANRDRLRELNARWREENGERKREADHVYYLAHREQHRTNGRRWYHANKEKALAIIKATRARHPEILKRQSMKRRARKFDGGPLPSKAEIRARVVEFGGTCAYCADGAYEHLDHIVPLSRGGTNHISNLAPSCECCNLSKGAKLLSEWKGVGP